MQAHADVLGAKPHSHVTLAVELLPALDEVDESKTGRWRPLAGGLDSMQEGGGVGGVTLR